EILRKRKGARRAVPLTDISARSAPYDTPSGPLKTARRKAKAEGQWQNRSKPGANSRFGLLHCAFRLRAHCFFRSLLGRPVRTSFFVPVLVERPARTAQAGGPFPLV